MSMEDAIYRILVNDSDAKIITDQELAQVSVDQIKDYLVEQGKRTGSDIVTKIARLLAGADKSNLRFFREVGDDIQIDLTKIPETDLRNAYNILIREKNNVKT